MTNLHPIEATELHARRERVFLVLAGLFLGSMTMLNILGISRFIDLSFLDNALARLIEIAAGSGIEIDLQPTTQLTELRFVEVLPDFTDADTSALVSLGGADDVNVFFIESFAGPGGAGYIALAPGTPGTIGVTGPGNGVLVSISSILGTPDYDTALAEVTLHEIGHFIGLGHTTESDFAEHDVLIDTPECGLAQDTNTNNMAEPDECPDGRNVMFWQHDFSQPKEALTEDQQFVLSWSPLVAPGGK